MVARSRQRIVVLAAAVVLVFVAGTAIAQGPPGGGPPPLPGTTPAPTPTPASPGGPGGGPPSPPGTTPTPAPTETPVPTPTLLDTGVPPATGMAPEKPKDMGSSDGGGSACMTDMVVLSAPVCVSFVGKEMQVYFIGDKSDAFPNGVAEVVRIPGRAVLRTKHPSGSGNILLWSGVNPVSGAKVFISWLSDDRLIHFHTYTWDRYYKDWKPYIFVIDKANQVKLWEG